jgi:hypothetical protein
VVVGLLGVAVLHCRCMYIPDKQTTGNHTCLSHSTCSCPALIYLWLQAPRLGQLCVLQVLSGATPHVVFRAKLPGMAAIVGAGVLQASGAFLGSNCIYAFHHRINRRYIITRVTSRRVHGVLHPYLKLTTCYSLVYKMSVCRAEVPSAQALKMACCGGA